MDYQNNQQMIVVPMDEIRLRRKTIFEAMCDKITEFCSTNGFLRPLSKISDILSYIITVICLTMTILNMAINHSNGSLVFDAAALIFGFLALSKRTALPLALVLSEMSLFTILNIILSIVDMADNPYAETGTVVMFVFNLIFKFAELALVTVLAVVSWSSFAVTLKPKQYQQQFYAQPAPSAAPVQPVQPAASANNLWSCGCGASNPLTANFCQNCGKPKNLL